ncbi:MAG: hypothetical protein ACXIVG_14275 [Pararhodobacter sp.]
MSPRVLALSLLVAMLGFAGLMASVGFLVRDPLPILAPHGSLELRSDTLQPPVVVRVSIDGSYRVQLVVDHPERAAPPDLALAPSGAGPIALDWQATGAFRHEGNGQMTRPGRWEVTLLADGIRESLLFVVRE